MHAPIRSHCGALGITPPTVSRQHSAASADAYDTGCWLRDAEHSSTKREGEDGFGLEHTFYRDENASRAMHLLMQFAHNVWQVFNSGFLENLSVGCRKVSQGMWGKKICEALHYCDYTATELETVYMNHAYEDAYLLTS